MPESLAVEPPPAYNQAGSSVPDPVPVTSGCTFELLLTLIHPSKRIRTQNRKTKNTKPGSENKGPYDIPIKTGWVTFLGIIAEKLAVEPSDLVMTSLEWHWLKPASGPWLPVQDESGFASMLKKVRTKIEPYVIIRMPVPVKKREAEPSGSTWDVVDELDSDFEDDRVAKKVRIRIIISLSYILHSISCR